MKLSMIVFLRLTGQCLGLPSSKFTRHTSRIWKNQNNTESKEIKNNSEKVYGFVLDLQWKVVIVHVTLTTTTTTTTTNNNNQQQQQQQQPTTTTTTTTTNNTKSIPSSRNDLLASFLGDYNIYNWILVPVRTSEQWIVSTESWCGYLKYHDLPDVSSVTLWSEQKKLAQSFVHTKINFQLIQSIVLLKIQLWETGLNG